MTATPRALLQILHRLEVGGGVNMRYGGVDCWPVVRNTFTTVSLKGMRRRGGRVGGAAFLRAVYDFIRLVIGGRGADAIILSDFKYRVIHGAKEYLRDASVISYQYEKQGRSSLILTQGLGFPDSAIRYRTLYAMIAICYFVSRFIVNCTPDRRVHRYVGQIFDRLGPDEIRQINASRESCIRNVYFVIVARWLFLWILRRKKPRRCFIVCYYSALGMALCAACRTLGIESADIQHGVGGSNMRSYAKWVSIPPHGFNTLPSIFFCWTHIDKVAIDRWAKTTGGVHQARVTGNLWREYVELTGRDRAAEFYIESLVSGYDYVVVYTASVFGVSSEMGAAILNMPDRYIFVVRAHPDTPESEIEAARSRYASQEGNVLFLSPSACGIDLLMRHADVHVTEWSASVYDALFEGVPSVVISDLGAQYFEDFVAAGYAVSAKSVEDICDAIKTLSGKRIQSAFQLTDESIAEVIVPG